MASASSGGHGTDFHVVDNGGGSYTVDLVILGEPCGQTDSAGTLFQIGLTNTGGSGKRRRYGSPLRN